MGVTGSWGAEGIGSGNGGFASSNNYGGVNRSHHNGSRHPNPPYGAYRNNGIAAPPNERRPAWQREPRPDTRLPPRPPPPAEYSIGGWGGSGMDGSRSERPEALRERDRERLPRSRGVVGGIGGARDVDTYIPSYGPDSGRRDDRRRWGERDDRRHNRDRDRLDYDDRGRVGRTHSRSRSPVRERDRDRIRERESHERERDVYRR
jgi:serine/threonine-protein kinase BUR1